MEVWLGPSRVAKSAEIDVVLAHSADAVLDTVFYSPRKWVDTFAHQDGYFGFVEALKKRSLEVVLLGGVVDARDANGFVSLAVLAEAGVAVDISRAELVGAVWLASSAHS